MADTATHGKDEQIRKLKEEKKALIDTLKANDLRLQAFCDQYEITASEVEELLIKNERVTAEKDKAVELLRIATEKSAQQESKILELRKCNEELVKKYMPKQEMKDEEAS